MKKNTLAVVVFCISLFLVYSQSESLIQVSTQPGFYNTSVLVSFLYPSKTYLYVSVNGETNKLLENNSLFFNAEKNTSKDFLVKTELYSDIQKTNLLESKKFKWTIDKIKPIEPQFLVTEISEGQILRFLIEKEESIEYQLYHSFSQTYASGTLLSNEELFLPLGTSMVAYSVDSATNKSNVISYVANPVPQKQKPFVIVNPVSGEWANKQSLCIESKPGSFITWSIETGTTKSLSFVYDAPLFLDVAGNITVTVTCQDEHNNEYSEKITYTVNEEKNESVSSFLLDQPIVYTDQIFIPEGFSYAFQDSSISFIGNKNIQIPTASSLTNYYPLELQNTETKSRYRFVVAANKKDQIQQQNLFASYKNTKLQSFENNVFPFTRIHNWNFIEISYDFPIFYSFDGASWQTYTKPIFTDREDNKILYWYSDEWQYGLIQKIKLPSAFNFESIALQKLSNSITEIKFNQSPYNFRYAISSYDGIQPVITDNSSVLKESLILDVPYGVESLFIIRLQAVYDGLVHGEQILRYEIDKKPPIPPHFVFSSNEEKLNKQEIFSVISEDSVSILITPSLYKKINDTNSFMLLGKEGEIVSYSIKGYTEDRAGNRSNIVEHNKTIELNAIYVGKNTHSSGIEDGSLLAPYSSLDQAIEKSSNNKNTTLYLLNDVQLLKSHSLSGNYSIIGNNNSIFVHPEAHFFIENNSFLIDSVTMKTIDTSSSISRMELPLMVKTNSFMHLTNARFEAKNSNFIFALSGSYSLFNTGNSTCRFDSCSVYLKTDEYAVILDARDTLIATQDSRFSIDSSDAVIFSVQSSKLNLKSDFYSVSALSTARIVESWGSSLNLDTLNLKKINQEQSLSGSAIFLDKNSNLLAQNNLKSIGFETLFLKEDKDESFY